MKKILFFLSTIFLLSACNSDNDSINNDDNTKYPVTLNIEAPKIDIETSSLKSTTTIAEGDPIFYHLIIYKENGEIYSQLYYDIRYNEGSDGYSTTNIFSISESKFSTTLNLPAGNYHIAMLVHRKDAKHPNGAVIPIVITENYNTDNYGPNALDKRHNGGAYFNTTDLTVIASQTEQNISMELQPMWSYIDVNIEDAQTFDVPEGTNALQFVVNPLYYGFNVKSKLAPFVDDRPIVVSLDSIRTNATYNLRTTVAKSIADNTISTKINYLKIDGDTTILETKQLPIPNSTLENGYYYNIHGALGNKNSGQSMGISLGEFNKDDVNIEF